MSKSENIRNNLFYWAKKELSQDAVIAWLLNDDKAKNQFLQKLTGDKGLSVKKVETQKHKMDVFVEAEKNGEKYAIIIEDKTDSYLHDEQHIKYIEKILKLKTVYKKIYFVYIKTGYFYFWENDDCKRYKKETEALKTENAEVIFKKFLFDEYKEIIESLQTEDEHLKELYVSYLSWVDGKREKNKWNLDGNITRNGFENLIFKDIDIKNYEIVYASNSANGKRDQKLFVYGICGKNAKNKNVNDITLKGNYYILPRIYIEDEIKIDLHFHLYVDNDGNTKDGYLPYEKAKSKVPLEEWEKYKTLQGEAVKIANEICNLPEGKKLKDNSLNLVMIKIAAENATFEEICADINIQLRKVFEAINKIENLIINKQ